MIEPVSLVYHTLPLEIYYLKPTRTRVKFRDCRSQQSRQISTLQHHNHWPGSWLHAHCPWPGATGRSSRQATSLQLRGSLPFSSCFSSYLGNAWMIFGWCLAHLTVRNIDAIFSRYWKFNYSSVWKFAKIFQDHMLLLLLFWVKREKRSSSLQMKILTTNHI